MVPCEFQVRGFRSRKGSKQAKLEYISLPFCSLEAVRKLFLACRMTALLDVRSLCRLPTTSKRRLNKKKLQLPRSQASKPTTDLGKIIGMSDSVLDMSASFFWNFINDIWTSDESIVVA